MNSLIPTFQRFKEKLGPARDIIASIAGWLDKVATAISTLNIAKLLQLIGIGGKGKAAGGPVMGGASYMVGERGPEMFVPFTDGMIIPNHALSGAGSTNNFYLTINEAGNRGNVIGDFALMKAMARA